MYLIPKIALALLIAFSTLFTFYQCSPKPESSSDLIVTKGRWTNESTGQSFAVDAGIALSTQIPRDSPCCNGFYEFEIPNFEEVTVGRFQPALYLSAASCSTSLAINGAAIALKNREYTSVGPVIPLPMTAESYPLKIKIETECPRLMFSGIWKRPLRVGEYLDLVAFQSKERNYQTITPLVSGTVFAALGLGFIAIYFMTDRRFSFYLDVCGGLVSWSVFLFFLSGVVRSEVEFGTTFTILIPV